MIEASRRSVITGLVALVAAPAIVRAASLMKIAPTEVVRLPRSSLMATDQITRESIQLWAQSNSFIKEIDEQYRREFGAEGAKIGYTLRIRLPVDYVVSDGPGWSIQEPTDKIVYRLAAKNDHEWGEWNPPLPAVPDKLALAAVAVAAVPLLLEKPVTRRFWKT